MYIVGSLTEHLYLSEGDGLYPFGSDHIVYLQGTLAVDQQVGVRVHWGKRKGSEYSTRGQLLHLDLSNDVFQSKISSEPKFDIFRPWTMGYYSWYRQIGKYFYLSNTNCDDTI